MSAYYILTALALIALYLALAVVLTRKYVRTHDIGFIWLGVAVFIWPLLSKVLDRGINVLIERLLRHQSIGVYPFTLVEHGDITIGSLLTAIATARQFVGVALLLVAV